jgi:hypothetical protein
MLYAHSIVNRGNISTTSTISTRRKSNSKSRQKWQGCFVIGGDTISTIARIPPPQDFKLTLKLSRVEIVEMSEVFSDCIYQRVRLKFWAIVELKE